MVIWQQCCSVIRFFWEVDVNRDVWVRLSFRLLQASGRNWFFLISGVVISGDGIGSDSVTGAGLGEFGCGSDAGGGVISAGADFAGGDGLV